jgi:hypothetical protein
MPGLETAAVMRAARTYVGVAAGDVFPHLDYFDAVFDAGASRYISDVTSTRYSGVVASVPVVHPCTKIRAPAFKQSKEAGFDSTFRKRVGPFLVDVV